jgi:tetratricopeptide (TPR) repeat protein
MKNKSFNLDEILLGNKYSNDQNENSEAHKDFICGRLNFDSKEYILAIKNFEDSLEKNKDDTELEEATIFFYLEAIKGLALGFLERKEYSKVTLLCDFAISQNFEPSEGLANIYALRGSANYCNYPIHETDFLNGINDFSKAIEILGENNERAYRLYEFRGDFKWSHKDLNGAYVDFKKALEFLKDKNDLIEKFNKVKSLIDKINNG